MYKLVAVIALAVGLIVTTNLNAEEQKAWRVGKPETPIGEKWWPHPLWGAGDEAGSTNWYRNPEVVQRGLSEADKGRVYNLGQDYYSDMPFFGERIFEIEISSGHFGGGNALIANQEKVTAQIGQVGTQFDGPGHIAVATGDPENQNENRYYNGFRGSEVLSESGLKHLGIEKLHPIAGRGILIDIAGAKNLETLAAGYEISMSDVRAALAAQNMDDFTLLPGDIILFRTGWSAGFRPGNKAYYLGEPGIGIEVAKWLAEGQIGIVGADNWGTEVIPNADPDCIFCAVHSFLIVRHGIFNQENLNLEALARDKVYRFFYMFTPVPIRGATGSPGAPIAID